MVTFLSPAPSCPSFQVASRSVAFAGSRHASVSGSITRSLIHVFGSLGFGFLTGCAPGVDESFRDELAESSFREKCFVACAFDSRLRRCEERNLASGRVVPDGLSPAAALHRRTVWIVRRASLLVLFPDDTRSGRWGRGSSLAVDTALFNLVPAFVVTARRPTPPPGYVVAPSSLFGLVEGFWVFPYPVHEGGTCEDQW